MKKIKKVIAVFLSVLMAISLFSVTAGAKEIDIAESSASTVHQHYGAGGTKVQYGGWDGTYATSNATHLFRIDELNGKSLDMSAYTTTTWYTSQYAFAYCLDPGKKATSEGTYNISGYWNNSNPVARALYYLYGSPGYADAKDYVINSLNNIIAANKRDGVSSIDGTGEDFQYAFSHLVISYLNDPGSLEQTDCIGVNWKKEVKNFASMVESSFSNAPDYFKAFYYNVNTQGQQRMAGWTIDRVKLQLQKTSAKPELTEGSPCYSLEGAVYSVYYDDSPGHSVYVGDITTDSSGFGWLNNNQSIEKHDYYAYEKTAPKGYLLDSSKLWFRDSGLTSADGTPVMNFTHREEPGNDPVTVVLYKEDAITHERVKALAGAEFTVSFYNNYYDTVAELEGVPPTRSWVIKTDETGYTELSSDYLVSGDEFYFTEGNPNPVLPYGTLTIQETKAPDGYQLNEEICFGKITDEGGIGWITGNITEDNNILIEEMPANGYVKIHKSDDSGNDVAGAVYGLYKNNAVDDKGMLSEAPIETVTTDENGAASFSSALEIGGKYYIQEIQAPDGYILNKTVYEAIITGDNSSAENALLVELSDSGVKFQIDKLDKDGNRVVGAKLQILESSGKVVDSWTSDKSAHYIYNKLIVGKTYTLHEVEAPDGYIVADDVKFTVSDTEAVQLVKMTDKKTKVEITKYDVSGSKELEGASLSVIDSSGKTVDSWVSVSEAHIIKGLTAGETYTLRETQAPAGYIIAEDVTFTVASDGSVTKVAMTDDVTKVEIEKNTDFGGALSGAKLQILDSSGKVVEQWTTDGSVHKIYAKLTAGATYTLHELEAPVGYKAAEDIEFTVATDGSVQSFKMVDINIVSEIELVKTSDDGQVEGVYFSITDNNGDSWGEYVTDQDGKLTVPDLLVYDEATEEKFSYTITELGFINDKGEYYIPEKYIVPEPQTITLDENAVNSVSFENKLKTAQLELVKTSEDGEVANISFNIKDSLGNDCGNFVTDKNGKFSVSDLPVYDGDSQLISYTITELGVKSDFGEFVLPAKYITPEPQTVTLSYGSVTSVSFENKLTTVKIIKTDNAGNLLSGVKLQVLDSSGNVVDDWVSNDEAHIIKGLNAGETYTLHEVEALDGYILAQDIEFTVSTDGSVTEVTMVNNRPANVKLPQTGGRGSILFTVSGVVLITAGVALLIALRKKKNDK